jgi:hypothetical protein
VKLPVLKNLVSSALALAVPKSGNEKTGPIAATYTGTDRTCTDCPHKGTGSCYYESGFRTRGLNARLNTAARDQKASTLRIARAEARAIDGLLTGKKRDGSNRVTNRPLRIHVGGDAPTAESAALIAGAARRYSERVDAPAYTYTHAWRDVPRKAWQGVSVLASVESVKDAKKALKRGYAPAIIVDHFDGDKASVVDGIRLIPCPAQTKDDVSCADCRLCMNADKLVSMNAAVAFAAHGTQAKKTKEILRAVNGGACPTAGKA